MVSNPSSHVRLFCLVFFCSALTQTVLTCMVGSREYKGHLQLKRSTAEQHIKTMLLCPTYSLQAVQLIHRDVAEHNVECHITFSGYAHFC